MTAIAPNVDLNPTGSRHAAPKPSRLLRHVRRWGSWGAAAIALGALATVGVRELESRNAAPPRLETALIDRGPIAARVTATGTTSALVTVQVGSQVSGRIDKLFVDFNSPVHVGQVVATIEPSLLRAAVAQARANWTAASAAVGTAAAQRDHADQDLARAKRLHAEGLMSQSDLDGAEANAKVGVTQVAAARASVSQAAAALDQATLNLTYATIVSPIDGVIISRNVDVGQTVAAALQAPTLFTIAHDLSRMQVDTSVAEADIGKVREGMLASFTVDAYADKVFQGKVRQVRDAAVTVQNVVTYDAVIDVDNTDQLLKPGMTASATFVYAERADVLRVANAALRFKPDASTIALIAGKAETQPAPPHATKANERVVWIAKGGRAEPRMMTVGISDGTSTEVVTGEVHPGDATVTEAAADGAAKRP